MRHFSWDKKTNCKRYHGTLNASACLVRYRMNKVSGCQGCPEGGRIEKVFGSLFDEDMKNNPNFVKKMTSKLQRLVFSSNLEA